MTPIRHSDQIHSSDQAIRTRVLHAIAGNRTPGLQFAGHFLGLEWQKVSGGAAHMLLPDGPHCRDANGAMNIVALGVLADNALAATARTGATPGARLGTLHLQLQFTGAPVAGDISSESRLLGRTEEAALQQSLSSATFYANGKSIGFGSGAFVFLDAPPGVTLAPLPFERKKPPRISRVNTDAPETTHTALIDISELAPHERAILTACDAALAHASPQASFIQHLWGGVPRRTAQGASNRVAIGPHIGNRVGHVQGGILFGLAATNACAAAPEKMMLSNASVWYISPGRGAALSIRSRVVHAGRTIAVLRTEIRTAAGERVVEAVTHHVARR
jgi:acyl-coenzyme A thioesterase PaaI-like protein